MREGFEIRIRGERREYYFLLQDKGTMTRREFFADSSADGLATINAEAAHTVYGYEAPAGCGCSGSQGSEPSRITDANGNLTERGYDKLGRLTMVTEYIADDANGIPKYETVYGYDAAGNLTSLTDAKGNVTRFEYDALNRLVKQTQPPRTSEGEAQGKYEIYAWNHDGTLDYKIDRKGRTIQYDFDRTNRIYRIDYPDASTQTIQYDKLGRTVDAINPAEVLHYDYDEQGRVTLLRQGTKEFTFTYYKNSTRKTLTDPEGREVTYTYDHENRLDTITDPVAGTIDQDFDALGRPDKRIFPNTMVADYGFDIRNRLRTLEHKANGGSVLSNRIYSYDQVGNVTDTVTDIATKHYDYDDLYRLTHALAEGESFTYDPVGNRLTYKGGSTWTNNEANQLKSGEGVTYTYDDSGNRASKTDGTGTVAYLYDYENRLTQVKVNGTTIASYEYDALNRRIRKDAGGAVTEYVYLPEGLYSEYDGTGTETKRYLYNPQATFMTDPLAMIQGTNAYYYHNDHLGTPQLMTDATQHVVWQAEYSAFGEANMTIHAVTNNLRFPGQYYDAETGLHYNYHRFYDPGVGKYFTPDPIGLAGGINLYVYVENNPINFTDPTGLKCGPGPLGMTPLLDFPGGNNFRKCCAGHDDCYTKQECQKPRKQCDDEFYQCMRDVCARSWNPTCDFFAGTYHGAVAGGGVISYRGPQGGPGNYPGQSGYQGPTIPIFYKEW